MMRAPTSLPFYAFYRSKTKPVVITALGVFGVAVVGALIVATQLPQC